MPMAIGFVVSAMTGALAFGAALKIGVAGYLIGGLIGVGLTAAQMLLTSASGQANADIAPTSYVDQGLGFDPTPMFSSSEQVIPLVFGRAMVQGQLLKQNIYSTNYQKGVFYVGFGEAPLTNPAIFIDGRLFSNMANYRNYDDLAPEQRSSYSWYKWMTWGEAFSMSLNNTGTIDWGASENNSGSKTRPPWPTTPPEDPSYYCTIQGPLIQMYGGGSVYCRCIVNQCPTGLAAFWFRFRLENYFDPSIQKKSDYSDGGTWTIEKNGTGVTEVGIGAGYSTRGWRYSSMDPTAAVRGGHIDTAQEGIYGYTFAGLAGQTTYRVFLDYNLCTLSGCNEDCGRMTFDEVRISDSDYVFSFKAHGTSVAVVHLSYTEQISNRPRIEAVVSGFGIPGGAIGVVSETPSAGGSGYVKGDILDVDGGSGGQVAVTSVDGSGGALEVRRICGGSGYAVGSEVTTSGGSGTGCKIDITSLQVGGNPALCAYLAMTGRESPTGTQLDITQYTSPQLVDWQSVLDTMKFCDSLRDGYGYEFNRAFGAPVETEKMIMEMTAAGRLFIVRRGTRWVFLPDRHQPADYEISEVDEVVSGSISCGMGTWQTANRIEAQYVDGDLEYTVQRAIAEDSTSLDATGLRQQNLDLTGVTNQQQAVELARWTLLSLRNNVHWAKLTVSYKTARQLGPGMVVDIDTTHPVLSAKTWRITKIDQQEGALLYPLVLAQHTEDVYTSKIAGEAEGGYLSYSPWYYLPESYKTPSNWPGPDTGPTSVFNLEITSIVPGNADQFWNSIAISFSYDPNRKDYILVEYSSDQEVDGWVEAGKVYSGSSFTFDWPMKWGILTIRVRAYNEGLWGQSAYITEYVEGTDYPGCGQGQAGWQPFGA